MKPTYSMDLMCKMLGGLALQDEGTSKPKHSNWTPSGAECVIEHMGQFYKINVTPVVLEKEIA